MPCDMLDASSAEVGLRMRKLRDLRVANDVPALLGRWAGLLRSAKEAPSRARALSAVLRYILEVHRGLDVDVSARVTKSVLAGTGAEVMATAEELIQIGVSRGRAEGKLEGRRATLRRLLRMKFQGAISERVLASVGSADEALLDRIEERILTATTTDELLNV